MCVCATLLHLIQVSVFFDFRYTFWFELYILRLFGLHFSFLHLLEGAPTFIVGTLFRIYEFSKYLSNFIRWTADNFLNRINMSSEPIGSPVVDSVSGGFSKRLVGFTKRPLYDDRSLCRYYTKTESNLCFLSVFVIVKIEIRGSQVYFTTYLCPLLLFL